MPRSFADNGRPVGHDLGMEARSRLVPLTGAVNFRDLGGYPAAGGRATRWGTLYRSDALHELTEPDVEAVVSLGIATVIDLRTGVELQRTGRGPLAVQPVGFHHLPVFQVDGDEAVAAPAPTGDEQSERYLWYLEAGRGALVEALTVVADRDRLPLVFHCAAGKDRTGVLAALVLDILGVEPEVIVGDYLITAERLPLIIERIQADPVMAARLAKLPAARSRVDAATMEGFLVGLGQRFGGARAWAESAGVATEVLDRMTELLLEPA